MSLREPRPRLPRRLAAGCALGALGLAATLTGCYTVLGDDTQGLPLTGDPVQVEALPHLNEKPLQIWEVQSTAANEPWVVMCETGTPQDSLSLCLPGLSGQLRVRRVHEPAAAKVLSGDYFFIGGFTGRRGVYVSRNGPTSTRLQVFLSRDLNDGDWAPAAVYDLPPGDPRVTAGPGQRLFVYRVTRPKTPRLDLLARDQQQQRTISYDAQDTIDDDPFFDAAGGWLIARVRHQADHDLILSNPDLYGEMRHVYVYSVKGDLDQDLGLRPRSIQNHPQGAPYLISCGADGLHAVLYGPTRDTAPMGQRDIVLDLPPPCDPGRLGFDGAAGLATYDVGEQYRRMPLMGGPADFIPKVKARRLLGRAGDGTEAYTLDPAGLYSNDASDGWIGDTRFMERGLFGYFRQDSQRVRYVEHAATPLSVGDLMSAPVPGITGPTTLLARNVPWPYFFDLAQPDGRILAISNAAIFPGPFNRLIAIDEAAGQAQLLMVGANNFVLLRQTNDLLVELVNSEVGFDLVRTPLPPKG